MQSRVNKRNIFTFLAVTFLLNPAKMAISGPTGEHHIKLAEASVGIGAYCGNIDIRKVLLDRSEVSMGESINFSVQVRNKGCVDEQFITVRAYSGGKLVAKKIVHLNFTDPGETMMVRFGWDTGNVSPGRYKVRIEAPLRSEWDSSDNSYEKEVTIR